jgi:DNA-binding transcriptional ArsR family regulator
MHAAMMTAVRLASKIAQRAAAATLSRRTSCGGGMVARMSDRSDVVASLDACTVRMVDRERVAAVQEMMPSDEDVEQAADVFALLGDPNRLRLLVALLAGSEMCVCDLAAVTGMSESAASHAVRWLRAHRIVSSPRRQGRMMYYRLDDAHVRMLLDLALTHTQHTQAMHPERDGA